MWQSLSISHLLAIAVLIASWASYGFVLGRFAKGTLSSKLSIVRLHWVIASATRVQKPFDGILLGHIINSVAFFGSATLLVLAGIIGLFASMTSVHRLVQNLPFVADASLETFAANILVIGLLLTFSFFLFTYSLRKFVYLVAIIGALPTDEDHPHREELFDAAATVLSEAIKSFNSGIRGYYYAIPALFLFVNPALSIFVTGLISTMLYYRQTRTKTAKAIDRFVEALVKGEGP